MKRERAACGSCGKVVSLRSDTGHAVAHKCPHGRQCQRPRTDGGREAPGLRTGTIPARGEGCPECAARRGAGTPKVAGGPVEKTPELEKAVKELVELVNNRAPKDEVRGFIQRNREIKGFIPLARTVLALDDLLLSEGTPQ